MKAESAPQLSHEAAETLAAALVGEMIQRWRQGERPVAEDFLSWHPELLGHPEAAADLIYEEICLRQEHGLEVPTEQVLGRFPQWRAQLEVLLDCQRLLGPPRAEPRFPETGDALGDFLLVAELGRGAHGRVFLASQRSLGDRPVVLKLAPREAGEHLSLARLQHTHIVPLYFTQDHPERGLRALCMPCFGGATLAGLLAALSGQPAPRRTGKDLLDALDRLQVTAICESAPAPMGPARQYLTGASYVSAVCWLGACLADALHYAHERGLVHLDLKPSNVLIAADGQPMLLDFHLAREPLRPSTPLAHSLGGTPGYMSPEQQAAVSAIQQGRTLAVGVDGRSDVYSLGVLLHEALAGFLPAPAPPGRVARALRQANARVSIGLADVIVRCLAADPRDRYRDMAALADDLRRHLSDLPLVGARNRSLAERWHKWRRRRPHGLARLGMALAVLAATAAVALAAAGHFAQRIEQARAALHDGEAQLERRQWEGAIRTLQRGASTVSRVPFQGDLADELERRIRLAEQGRVRQERLAGARDLHALADHVRFLYGTADLTRQLPAGLAERCGELWARRSQIVNRLCWRNDSEAPTVRADLLDLAIFCADMQVSQASLAGKKEGRRRALRVLDEAEQLFGPSLVLDEERRVHGARGTSEGSSSQARRAGGGKTSPGCHASPGQPEAPSAFEHCALGRALLRRGDLDGAAAALHRAVRLRPDGLWPNFYLGCCAFRQERFEEAVTAYSVAIGAAPQAAGCFFNRALAQAALGNDDGALGDYDRAAKLAPTLAAVFLNRGMLHHHAGRRQEALADLRRAEELGASPAVVSFDFALVHLASGDQGAAIERLHRVLRHDPTHSEARKLLDRLRPPKKPQRSEKSAPASPR
jgi:serine/threonine protein kinase/Flp pilus assembly protein TadD